MLELNKVLLVGRLTRDPEYRSTTTGRAVASLGLAVNRRSFNKETGGSTDETVFVDVEAWERTAEFCKNYLHKGSGIYVEGRLKLDQWQDRETGRNQSKIKVVAERIQFAESKAEAERSQGGSYQPEGNPAPRTSNNAPQEPSRAPAAAEPPSYDDGDANTTDDLPF